METEFTGLAPITVTVVGEAVAGEAAKVKKQISDIIKGVNSSTFTLAELLHSVKAKQFYTKWGHETFGQYAKSLDLKVTKSYYLVRIIEAMMIAGVPREVYEPVGIAKLRVIAKLEPTEEYKGKSGAVYIKALTETAAEAELDTLKEVVDLLQGKTGDDAVVWLNIAVNKSARDKVIQPAITSAKMQVGTVATDADGQAKDASDGRALELICAEFLSGAPTFEVALDSPTEGKTAVKATIGQYADYYPAEDIEESITVEEE